MDRRIGKVHLHKKMKLVCEFGEIDIENKVIQSFDFIMEFVVPAFDINSVHTVNCYDHFECGLLFSPFGRVNSPNYSATGEGMTRRAALIDALYLMVDKLGKIKKT